MRAFVGVLSAILALIFLITLWGSWYTVDQGEVGVVLHNGEVVDTAQPGLHMKMPWITSIQKFETRQQKWTKDKIEAYSKDLQPANLTVTLNYHIDGKDAADLYGRYGANYEDNILAPATLSAVKVVFGQYDAPTAIANRAAMVLAMQKAVQSAITSPDIVIDALQLENVEFSPQFVQAVESRMQKEIEVQQELQTLAKTKVQADMARATAQGLADAVVFAAQADAQKTRLNGEAQAAAIKAQGDALKANPGLVALKAVEAWDGKLPSTMLPGSALPFVDVTRTAQP